MIERDIALLLAVCAVTDVTTVNQDWANPVLEEL
jgi:hypothetical protein